MSAWVKIVTTNEDSYPPRGLKVLIEAKPNVLFKRNSDYVCAYGYRQGNEGIYIPMLSRIVAFRDIWKWKKA